MEGREFEPEISSSVDLVEGVLPVPAVVERVQLWAVGQVVQVLRIVPNPVVA